MKLLPIFYSGSYSAAGHEFDTTRKAEWVAESLEMFPVKNVSISPPATLLAEEHLCDVHSPEYVRAVRDGEPRMLAESQGFKWDAGLWEGAVASSSGVVAAGFAAMLYGAAGSLSSGLHHARRARGAGFCTFNGLALAARAALASGAQRVLILDFDAHCGGGTYSLVKDDVRISHWDVAVNPYDIYIAGSGSGMRSVTVAEEYLPTIERGLSRMGSWGKFDLCLYNAGMDPHENCDVGGLPGITTEILAERERMVFEWARATGTPIAFVLAGGYVGKKLSQSELVHLHRLTINAAAGQPAEEAPCASS